MNYGALVSTNNLTLAWRRISTGFNLQYKRFFRDLYLAYEISHEANIRRLRRSLKGGWRPTPPYRVFLPKPSGLQRPLGFLAIEDQIVLQAVANLFARKIEPRRRNVEKSVVFSNILNKSHDSIFFLEDWHKTYRLFEKQCEIHFRDGYRWIADFDLAAFYETISHEMLVRAVFPRGGSRDLCDRIRTWLRCWTGPPGANEMDHGIPQGPLASDFLAECLLLPLDEALKGNCGSRDVTGGHGPAVHDREHSGTDQRRAHPRRDTAHGTGAGLAPRRRGVRNSRCQ